MHRTHGEGRGQNHVKTKRTIIVTGRLTSLVQFVVHRGARGRGTQCNGQLPPDHLGVPEQAFARWGRLMAGFVQRAVMLGGV